MWHALSWLHNVSEPTILFYLVISCSYDLMIMLHDNYSSRTSHVHYIYVTTCMHSLPVHDLSSQLFLLLLLLSVLDTATHIVLIISMPYLYCYCIFTFSFLLFFPFVYSCWSALTDLYYFLVSRLESWYRELIVEHILIQLFSGEFNFFSWLVLFRYGGWYCWWFCFSYICFYPYAWLYMHICVLSCSFWQLKIFMEEISLFVSICWPLSRTRTPYLGGGAQHSFVGIRARFIFCTT